MPVQATEAEPQGFRAAQAGGGEHRSSRRLHRGTVPGTSVRCPGNDYLARSLRAGDAARMFAALRLAGADALELPEADAEHDDEGDKGKDDGQRDLMVHVSAPLLLHEVVT